ncbi:unnamed protein product [Blepharisma stoltei]|uniref:Uncharacterized protein n=1 Tax=Blepharisma stoltei TaxID=1481888 RepID=A0AAU9J6C9_9CILI|nr:unnamed protein product [Blepharisma stoltei]
MKGKKGKKVKKSHDIDEFISKEFELMKKNRKAKPLLRANETAEQPSRLNQMIRLKENEDLPPPHPQPQPRESSKKSEIKPKEKEVRDEEIYEEDFEPIEEEEMPPPPPPPPRPKKGVRDITPIGGKRQSSTSSSSKIDYSIEDIKKGIAHENEIARKKEEEEESPSSRSGVISHIKSAPKQIEEVEISQEKVEEPAVLKEEEENNLIYKLSEFDVMIEKLNKGVIQNSTVQSNSDNVEKEIQTSEIEYQNKEAQWPGDMGKLNEENIKPTGSINKFLRKVLPAMEILLEENITNKGGEVKLKAQEKPETEYIKSQLSLPVPTFLNTRFPNSSFKITDLAFFPQKRNFLAIVYSLEKSGSLILVWDVQQPRKPSRLLLSDSTVSTVVISRNSEHIAIAGTDVGGILLWDLRESSSFHEIIHIDDKKYTLRRPTYSTEGVVENSHIGSVQKIIELAGPKGQSFSIASLDNSGQLISWSIAELPIADLAGSEIDLGLRVGGRVKIVKSNSLAIPNLFKLRVASGSVFGIDPSDNQKFIYGNSGNLYHGNRFGNWASPNNFEGTGSTPTCVAYSSSENFKHFLVGFSCGSIALYDKNFSAPKENWAHVCGSLIRIGWDPNGKEIFYCIDMNQQLMVWDLKRKNNGPILTIKLKGEWQAIDWILPENINQELILAASNGENAKVYSIAINSSNIR